MTKKISKKSKIVAVKKQYFFPTKGKTVEAKDLAEAKVIVKGEK